MTERRCTSTINISGERDHAAKVKSPGSRSQKPRSQRAEKKRFLLHVKRHKVLCDVAVDQKVGNGYGLRGREGR